MKAFQFNVGTQAALYAITALVYLFVFAPLFFVIYASFDPNEIMSFPYKGFSLRWYKEFFASPTLYIAAGNSFALAALSGLCATLLRNGGLLDRPAHLSRQGGAASRHQRADGHLRSCSALLLTMVDLASSAASRLVTPTAALPSVRLPRIQARLLTSGRDFEEAALTLGADDIRTALEVTIPLLGPALLGSFLLCVTVSFDEFSATQFLVVPRTQTMPIQIYSMIQTGVTPTVNVFATLLTLITVAIPLFAQIAFGVFRRTFITR
jgi:ABC-type spermidine/putrescine transport system permease subunit II